MERLVVCIWLQGLLVLRNPKLGLVLSNLELFITRWNRNIADVLLV
jgi:hypothetical protein